MRNSLIESFRRAEITAIEGAADLVRRCAATGVPVAVASGSPLEAIGLTLRALGISNHVQLTISSEQVSRGKPHPDVFLAAAAKLSVRPEACIVFEDSLVGVQAARAAGMRCVVRPSSADPSISAAATLAVSHWDQVNVESFVTHDGDG